MDNEKTGSFNIYQREHYEKVLEEIKLLDVDQLNPSEIYSSIIEKFGGLQISVKVIFPGESIFLYRITNHELSGESKNIAASYSYNPNPTKLGRANLPNEHVFYGSLHPFTCLKEMKDKLSDTYYLSEWEFTPTKQLNIGLLIAHVNTEEETISATIANGLEAHVKALVKGKISAEFEDSYWYSIQAFSKLFSEPGSKYYPISASIASNWLNAAQSKGVDIGMLMYPSVTSQAKEINLAVRKDIADDKGFKLKSVTKFNVNQNDFLGDHTVILERGFLNKSDKLNWKKPKYKLGSLDFNKYQIQTHCRCKITEEQKKTALYNIGSPEFSKIDEHAEFFKNEINTTLKNSFRIGIKNPKILYQRANTIPIQVVVEMTNTIVRINSEEHSVKYLVFNITAECIF